MIEKGVGLVSNDITSSFKEVLALALYWEPAETCQPSLFGAGYGLKIPHLFCFVLQKEFKSLQRISAPFVSDSNRVTTRIHYGGSQVTESRHLGHTEIRTSVRFTSPEGHSECSTYSYIIMILDY